jgi:molybdate transport system ATP-binding protein
MIDVDLQLHLSDASRRFELQVQFATEAPVLALYGPSGAGKSLTLQAMAGLLQPAAGHVRVAGRTLYDARAGIDVPARQRGLGYLFQDYALFPHLSVRQNIAFGLSTWWRRRLAPADARRVDELLQAFELQGLAQARPQALSGGQRQRVALARALACEPSVLLLDEPFAALNPQLRQSLRQELAEVRARWQIPMVMITHDIEDVLALADSACVIEHGRVVREVDLRSGECRERQVQQLDPAAATDPQVQARRAQLQQWLAGPDRC